MEPSFQLRCTVPSETGKTWVWDAEMGFVKVLCMKCKEPGLSVAELGSVCHEPRKPVLWTQESVLRRNWPWLVENGPWYYPS